MKKKIFSFIAVALIAAMTLSAAPLAGAPAATVNLVKNTAITKAEVDQMVAQYRGIGAELSYEQVLTILINNEVFRQGAERDGIKASSAEIDAQIRIIRGNLETQLGGKMTDEQFASVVLDQTGMEMDEYREALGEQIVTDKYIQSVKGAEIQKKTGEIQVTDREIDNFFRKNRQQFFSPEHVKLAHVFIPKTGDEAKDKASAALLTDVAEDIKNGRISFEKAVTTYSQDPGSKEIGGDIGWLTMDDQQSRMGLGDDFFYTALSMDAGEISPMVESNTGYHILKVSVHNEGKLLGLDDKINPVENITVRDFIKGTLGQEKTQKIVDDAINEMIDDLKAQARIRIY